MSALAMYAWESDEWEAYGIQLLRQRYGVKLVPVPDKSGGDGGLDAYTTTGIAWQCYGPEGEPLQPKKRYELQRNKITADLKKLITYEERVKELLGPVVLTEWVLLSPRHESADLVAHCATKTTEMRQAKLPFLSPDFCVHVQALSDFGPEHQLLQGALILPKGLHKPVPFPELTVDGEPFEKATGPLIEVMDKKLQKVVPSDSKRAILRAEYLRAKVAGDDKLGHFEDSMPDVAEELREVIAAAKRRVTMEQTLSTFTKVHLGSVEEDLSSRLKARVPEMSDLAVEQLAQAAVTQWLQECSMRFDDDTDTTTEVAADG